MSDTQDSQSRKSGSSNSLAVVLPVAVLFQRTQTTVNLLHEVVQESSPAHWLKLGTSSNQAGERDMAIFAFRQCLKLDNMNWQEALHLAVLLGQLQQGEDAAEALLKSYETHCPHWYPFYKEISDAQWQMLRQELEASKSTARNQFVITIALSLVRWMTNNHDFARETLEGLTFSFEKEIRNSPLWHHLLGFFLNSECKYVEAISSYNKSIDINPKYASAFFGRGIAKGALALENGFMYSTTEERYAEKLSDFAISIELDKDYADVYYERAIVNAHPFIKKYEEAILDFSRVIELQPHYYNAYNKRSEAKRCLKDWTGAYEDRKLRKDIQQKGKLQF